MREFQLPIQGTKGVGETQRQNLPCILPLKAMNMMALIRFIYDFILKEESMAFGYIRKHPRRILLMSLDAILSVSLVYAGFSYASASSHDETSLALLRVGAAAMPSSQLASHIRSEGGTAYWLGDKSGFDIATHENSEQSRSISYVEKGSDPSEVDVPEISIITYRGSIDVSRIRQFGTWLESSTTVTASGLIVEYDLNSMMGEIVAINGTSNVVYIRYSTIQTLQTLMQNAVALRLVA